MNTRTNTAPAVILAAFATVLASCATPIPGALEAKRLPASFESVAAPNATVWPSSTWWTAFDSRELNDLIGVARAENLDMAAAATRVTQAEAQFRISHAALFPNVDAQGTAERTRSTQGGKTATANAFGMSLNATYQVDLWGRARASVKGANQQVLASVYAQEGVALTVTSDVANSYLDVLALRERIAVAQRNVEAALRILATVQAQVRHGSVSALSLAQQQAQLQSIEVTIAPLEEQEKEALIALAVLLGRLPEGFSVEGSDLSALKIPGVGPGLPSELLHRRPDVAEAEANLAAAHANVDIARAAFLPQIGLTASGGVTSSALKDLFDGPSLGWSLGGSLVQTVFDGGALKGQLALSKAKQEELIADYRKAALNAFSDVERALSQVASLKVQAEQRSAQTAAAEEAFRIAERQYAQGAVDLLSVLNAQQTLFAAQDQFVQVRLALAQADVGLYQALGGGWSEPANAITQPIPDIAAVGATATGLASTSSGAR